MGNPRERAALTINEDSVRRLFGRRLHSAVRRLFGRRLYWSSALLFRGDFPQHHLQSLQRQIRFKRPLLTVMLMPTPISSRGALPSALPFYITTSAQPSQAFTPPPSSLLVRPALSLHHHCLVGRSKVFYKSSSTTWRFCRYLRVLIPRLLSPIS